MILFSTIIILFLSFIHINASECGDDSLVKYDKNGLPKYLPWAVLVKLKEITYCTGILLSATQIVTWNCHVVWEPETVELFFNRKFIIKQIESKYLSFPTIKSKFKYAKLGDYNIITLEKPLKLSKKIAPICVTPYPLENKGDNDIYYRYEDRYFYGNKRRRPVRIHAIICRLKIFDEFKGVAPRTFKENNTWYFDGWDSNAEARMLLSRLAKRIKL